MYEVAFRAANDHQNSCFTWITEIALRLAEEDTWNIKFLRTTTWNPRATRVVSQDDRELMFPFPERGWEILQKSTSNPFQQPIKK